MMTPIFPYYVRRCCYVCGHAENRESHSERLSLRGKIPLCLWCFQKVKTVVQQPQETPGA